MENEREPNLCTVGIISDTHGLLRPEALRTLRDVELIVHAGDIGKPEVLYSLETIAPVTAVRGNVDRGAWAEDLRRTELIRVGGKLIHVLHDLGDLNLDPAASSIHAVVSGHSHRPSVMEKNGVLYVNPGSAGPRRFRLPVSVALLRIDGAFLEAQIIELRV